MHFGVQHIMLLRAQTEPPNSDLQCGPCRAKLMTYSERRARTWNKVKYFSHIYQMTYRDRMRVAVFIKTLKWFIGAGDYRAGQYIVYGEKNGIRKKIIIFIKIFILEILTKKEFYKHLYLYTNFIWFFVFILFFMLFIEFADQSSFVEIERLQKKFLRSWTTLSSSSSSSHSL